VTSFLRPVAGALPAQPGFDYSKRLRDALVRSRGVLSERDPERLQARVLLDALELLDASAARLHVLDPDDRWHVTQGIGVVPPLAEELEAELLHRALAAGSSLLSSHPVLDPGLRGLAEQCRGAGITTQVLLLRAHEETVAATGVHWLGRHRTVDYEARGVFHTYWENAGLVLATTRERRRVEGELGTLRAAAERRDASR
jgi:hypothetical protein